jgi:hypothetical protein
MYKAKPLLVIVNDRRWSYEASRGPLSNYHRDFYYPTLARWFDLKFFDQSVQYPSDTVFLHDAYHQSSSELIWQHLHQGYRIIINNPTERKINPSPLEPALAWSLMHPDQVFWLISGNDLRHWPEVRYSEIPFWFWLHEQYGDIYRDYVPHPQPTRRFLCLMNNPHLHRRHIWTALNTRPELLSQGLVSFRSRSIFLEDEPPSPLPFWLDRVLNPNWYDTTAVSLVSETDVQSDAGRSPWLTEKTTKPMMMQHPFLLQAQPHSLQHLHSMGFETFPELWDESYDSDPDWKRRTKRLLDIVENLDIDSIRDARVQQKLEHNRQRFWDRAATAEMFQHSVIGPVLEWINA